MSESKIEWTDVTWNPVTGCSPISPGCANCYAKRMSKRLAGRCGYPADDLFRVTLHLDKLDTPLGWKKPRRVFVCSMGDLFHDDVPEDMIGQVWLYATLAPQHTYLFLTKRPERMNDIFTRIANTYPSQYPASNIWLGVTAENQEQADKRIPILLQTPAAIRFVSVEPMLSPVDLEEYLPIYDYRPTYEYYRMAYPELGEKPILLKKGLDWVICGGETGPGARPMHLGWARNLRNQCQEAGEPFFFKQWGEWKHINFLDDGGEKFERVGKKAAGRLLDGVEWSEYPEVR